MKTSSKKFSKAPIALALSAMMAITAAGLSQFVKLTASAAEASGIIGYEKDATVSLTSKTPATLTVDNDVEAGMYYMYAELEADYADILVSSPEMEWPAYLQYNASMFSYMAVVYAEAGLEYTLSTYIEETEYTVTAYLSDLSIGEFNDYSLNDLRLSADAPVNSLLDFVNGEYMVVVDVYEEVEDITLSVNGVELTKNPEAYNAYTATVDFTSAKSLTLTTSSTENITVSITLREIVKAEELVMGEPVELSLWQEKVFSYTATESGYQVLDIAKNPANSYINVVLKSDPNSYDGTYIEEGYPINFVAGQTYYFALTYTGTEWVEGAVTPDTATFTFNLATWEAPTIEADRTYYVPVANSVETAEQFKVNATGEYLVSIFSLPMEAYAEGFEVTLYYNGKEYPLNVGTSFTAQINFVETEQTIMLVSNQQAEFVCGIMLSKYVDTTIVVGKAKEITLNGYETMAYSLYDLPAGVYSIDVIGGNGNVTVYDSYYRPVVSNGSNSGLIYVSANVFEYMLFIENNSDDAMTFSVLVANKDAMALGQAKEVTLSAENNTATYYVGGLAEGNFQITLDSNYENVTVKFDGVSVPLVNGKGEFTVTAEQADALMTLEFAYGGDEEVTFNATIMPLNLMELDVAKEITVSSEKTTVTYYITGLTVDSYYNIMLSKEFEGMVYINGIGAAYYPEMVTFYADTEIITVTFEYYGEGATTFEATVVVSEE